METNAGKERPSRKSIRRSADYKQILSEASEKLADKINQIRSRKK